MTATKTNTPFQTKNSIPSSTRSEVSAYLNDCLATLIDLQMQAKQAHWNLRGPGFIGLHLLFDSLYAGVDKLTDAVAERIAQLGGLAQGTASVVAKTSSLDEYPLKPLTIQEHVALLSQSIAKAGGEFRKAIDWADEKGDAVTSDLATDVTKELDIWLWKVEANGS